MVKKATKAKTKKEETIEDKIDEVVTETPKKESTPQVMQVVEVMDEESEMPKTEQPEEVTEQEVTHSEMVEPVVPEFETSEVSKTEEEKKQEVVSEFFSKKEQPATFGYPDITVHKKSPITGVFMWAFGVILLVVGIGAVIILTSRGSLKMPSLGPKPSPTPTVAPLPTATPVPTVDKTTLNIQVLNGSGTAGEAGKMKTLLEEKGYTVVGTGNAKTYDYDKTEIQVTAVNEAVISVLQTDLTGSYMVGSTAATLKESLPYNVLVIVGKE